LVILALFIIVSPVLAAHPDTNTEIENLKHRIEALEAETAGEEAEEPPFRLFSAGKHLTFSGLLELEASYNNIDGGDDSSDLSLATFEFSTEVTVNDNLGGHVILLYEEEDPDDETVKVDEAVIYLKSSSAFHGQTPAFYGGKLYVSFGKFNSGMISDPLTLELGETNDTAALVALEGELWNLSFGVFNGGTDAAGDDNHIDSFVSVLEITPIDNLSFGISYISDLAESDNGLVADPALYTDSVAGASAFVSATFGQFGLDGEFLGALDDFDAALIGQPDVDLTGEKPTAWNLEISWMPVDDLQLAARYEQASDFQDDVTRYGIAGSYGLFGSAVLALEYLHADPENDPNSDTLTAQLAFEF